MPVIGIETIESLARAGVQVLAVEASHTMLADTLEALEAALATSDDPNNPFGKSCPFQK